MLGAPKDRNTSMLLAEYWLPRALRGHKIWKFPIRIVDGKTEWDSYDDVINEDGDFDQIHETFSKETGLVREGRVGSAKTYLMPVRDLVDFAVEWMIANRKERT